MAKNKKKVAIALGAVGVGLLSLFGIAYAMKPKYKLTLEADKTAVLVGEYVTFTGKLTKDSEVLSCKTITLFVNDNPVANTHLETDGTYTIKYAFPSEGTYKVYTEAEV